MEEQHVIGLSEFTKCITGRHSNTSVRKAGQEEAWSVHDRKSFCETTRKTEVTS